MNEHNWDAIDDEGYLAIRLRVVARNPQVRLGMITLYTDCIEFQTHITVPCEHHAYLYSQPDLLDALVADIQKEHEHHLCLSELLKHVLSIKEGETVQGMITRIN